MNKVMDAIADIKTPSHGAIGSNSSMADIYRTIERIANSRATILIYGESGSGKRVMANDIHNASHDRRDKPFIEISCGALPKELIDSELFGHARGSFTGAVADRKGRFELADGGTVLLDDIDCLSLDLQVKLLRVLQHKEFERVGDCKTIKVDVRIIAATNQNLIKAVTEKKFREDLYYRLNVISINIPPLRERKEDVPLLVDHFIKLYAQENYKNVERISGSALRILTDYSWPGNIRELENIIERAVVLDRDDLIDGDDLPEFIINANRLSDPELDARSVEIGGPLKEIMLESERVYLLKVLKDVGWNKKEAARRLGINRNTLYNRLSKCNAVSMAKQAKN